MFRTLVILTSIVFCVAACDPALGVAKMWNDPPPDAGDTDDDGGTDGDTDTDTDTDVSGPCDDDEAYDDGADLCWTRCPIGMSWDGAACTGSASSTIGADAPGECNGNRRLPTLDEYKGILDSCNSSGCDSCSSSDACSSMFTSGIQSMDFWMDEECTVDPPPPIGPDDGRLVISLDGAVWMCIPLNDVGTTSYEFLNLCVKDAP